MQQRRPGKESLAGPERDLSRHNKHTVHSAEPRLFRQAGRRRGAGGGLGQKRCASFVRNAKVIKSPDWGAEDPASPEQIQPGMKSFSAEEDSLLAVLEDLSSESRYNFSHRSFFKLKHAFSLCPPPREARS